MKIIYANAKVENQCTSLKIATKFFGGNNSIAISLHSRINAIKGADVIKDIIVTPQFRFHKLQGKLDGYFAIDVKTRKEKWRVILCPLDEDEKQFNPCNIDEIASVVRIVEIREVSAHYE